MDNIWVTWGDVFNASLQSLWWGFIQFAPKLILAIIFFIIGWILGSLIAKAFEQVFSALKVDSLFHSIGAGNFFRRAGMNLNTGYFIGQVIKWFVIIVFLLPSLNLIGLNYVASFLKDDVLGFLPRVVVAALVLVIATIVAEFLSKTVIAGSKAMNLSSTNMLGSLVKYTVWVFAFIIALGQLGIAEGYMNTLFAGIVGMIALGGALAFGLGSKDAAGRLVSRIGKEMFHNE
ncbi:MAG: Conserved TM helix repeat-containing protein [Parcubacteria group bacterium GW2011_GWF2_38_8]|nr:MAG: Conserved TM helix repeat-containing protein [Parcubacteria group bacterium GW2011_GWF2_38_8]